MKIDAMIQSIPPAVKPVLDFASVIAWLSALAGQLTTILGLAAMILTVAWGCIRLYETRTMQKWFGRKDFNSRNGDSD